MFKDYLTLCKPRVVAMMMLTAIIAMFLASPSDAVPWAILVFGSVGIALAACSGGIINQLIDRRYDALMSRTQHRPIPAGRIKPVNALLFALILTFASMAILYLWVNPLTAALSFLTLVGYAIIYTVFLKRATPQNIVIGGLAGAMPPLLGWVAVTGRVDAGGLLLVLIIFTWTPPHFWALAIARYKEYQSADIPMLPVTHGIPFTRLNILLYTLLMIAVTYLPYVIDQSGLIYVAGVTLLNAGFLFHAIRLFRTTNPKHAMSTFYYSITYLSLLFVLLLVDHYFLYLM